MANKVTSYTIKINTLKHPLNIKGILMYDWPDIAVRVHYFVISAFSNVWHRTVCIMSLRCNIDSFILQCFDPFLRFLSLSLVIFDIRAFKIGKMHHFCMKYWPFNTFKS